MQFVTRPDRLSHGHRWIIRRRLLHDRLMQIGIERLTDGIDGPNAMFCERLNPLLVHELDPFDELCRGGVGRDGLYRAFEVVECR